MTIEPFSTAHSTAHLDYLQRSGRFKPTALSAGTPSTHAPDVLRRLWRIKGVGRIEKKLFPNQERRTRLPSEDVLIGVYGYKIPLAFLILGEPGGVTIHLGTWLPAGRGDAWV